MNKRLEFGSGQREVLLGIKMTIQKRKDNNQNKQFWEIAEDTYQRVRQWPSWKRGEPASEKELQEIDEIIRQQMVPAWQYLKDRGYEIPPLYNNYGAIKMVKIKLRIRSGGE